MTFHGKYGVALSPLFGMAKKDDEALHGPTKHECIEKRFFIGIWGLARNAMVRYGYGEFEWESGPDMAWCGMSSSWMGRCFWMVIVEIKVRHMFRYRYASISNFLTIYVFNHSRLCGRMWCVYDHVWWANKYALDSKQVCGFNRMHYACDTMYIISTPPSQQFCCLFSAAAGSQEWWNKDQKANKSKK